MPGPHTHFPTHKFSLTACWSPLSPILSLWFTAQCFSAFWTQISNQRISCSFLCQNPHSNPSHFVHTVAHAPLKHLSVCMNEGKGWRRGDKQIDRKRSWQLGEMRFPRFLGGFIRSLLGARLQTLNFLYFDCIPAWINREPGQAVDFTWMYECEPVRFVPGILSSVGSA